MFFQKLHSFTLCSRKEQKTLVSKFFSFTLRSNYGLLNQKIYSCGENIQQRESIRLSTRTNSQKFQHCSRKTNIKRSRQSLQSWTRIQGKNCCDFSQPKRFHIFQTPQIHLSKKRTRWWKTEAKQRIERKGRCSFARDWTEVCSAVAKAIQWSVQWRGWRSWVPLPSPIVREKK